MWNTVRHGSQLSTVKEPYQPTTTICQTGGSGSPPAAQAPAHLCQDGSKLAIRLGLPPGMVRSPRGIVRRREVGARRATDTASAGSHQQPPPLRAGTAGGRDGPAPSTPGPHGAGSTSRSGSASPPPQIPVADTSARPSHGSPRRARPPQPPSDRPRTPPRRGASDRASAARSTRAPLPKCHVLSCFRDTV